MITASHNPAQYNGCKLNLGHGSVFAEELQNVLKIIQNEDFATGAGIPARDSSVNEDYIDYVAAGIKLQRPVKVIVAAPPALPWTAVVDAVTVEIAPPKVGPDRKARWRAVAAVE